MASGDLYLGIGTILLLVIIYLASVKLKVKEIIAEVEGSRRTVEELFTLKTKKIVQLKAILEPHENEKIKNLFKKLDRALDDFIKSTTEEKIIKSEDINSLLKQIIEEAKNNKHLILDESFHTIIGDLGAINTRLTYAKSVYMRDINQYEKMRSKFPFSIFPWPKWEFGMIMPGRRFKRNEERESGEEVEEVEKTRRIKVKETGIVLDEEEKRVLEKIKKKEKSKKKNKENKKMEKKKMSPKSKTKAKKKSTKQVKNKKKKH